jgi:hypothetical protein
VEPNLAVADELLPVLNELMRLEPLFHAAAGDATPQRFEELVDSEFWEVGASGRRYSREFALSVVSSRQRDPAEDHWKTSGFRVFEVAADNYLLTYTLEQPDRITRRATLWRRVGGNWKAVYHQGTVVQEAS